MIAYYYDLDDCTVITATHVEDFRTVLKTCAPFYNDGVLKLCENAYSTDDSCYETEPDTVPEECYRENIVFDTLNAIVDTQFIQNGGKVKYTKLIVEDGNTMNAPKDMLEAIHEYLYPQTGAKFGSSTLEGYKAGNKMDVFTKQLLADNVFSGGAFLFVFCLMWLHTSSGFVSLFAFIQIFLNLGVAYGIYMSVFNLPFFPFLNLVGVFVVIGIGADDVFVFMDAWKQTVQVLGEDAEISDRMAYVIHRAGGSMFITSLTTSSAFVANAMSPVTSLRCFGLFCAIVIIVDYFLMLCYVPALVVIYERYVVRGEGMVGSCLKPLCCQFCKCCTFCQVPQDPTQLRPTERWFKNSLGPFILKGKFVFLAVLVGVASFLSFKASQLSRSTSSAFQTFKPEHPMERYDLELKEYFNLGGSGDVDGTMGATFVFGIYGEDNGNHWDPDDWGKLELVNNFRSSLANVNSQERMAAMCDNAKDEKWYRDPCEDGGDLDESLEKFCRLLGEICPMRNFKHFVTAECAATSDDLNILFTADCHGDTCWDYYVYPQRTTCCGLAFPVADEDTFHTCFKAMAVSDDATKSYRTTSMGNGLWFNPAGEITVVKHILPTNIAYQAQYEKHNAYYEQMVSFLAQVKKGSMSSAFFDTGLEFYDLQRSLSEGAYQSAGLSFLLAFLVLALTTRNPLLTCLSLLTIFCIVGSIVGVLVIDGWQLNILESVIISVAVGMSVDFVAHYSHSYLHSEGADRDERVLGMMATMGVSVLTGAITTFVAGFFMSLAQTLFFFQFGVFMMSTMGFAWIYTNFMFAPLLSIVGPRERAVAASRNHGISDPQVEISKF
jgi:predicted RND superfamily exporter protein